MLPIPDLPHKLKVHAWQNAVIKYINSFMHQPANNLCFYFYLIMLYELQRLFSCHWTGGIMKSEKTSQNNWTQDSTQEHQEYLIHKVTKLINTWNQHNALNAENQTTYSTTFPTLNV
jgi:hypothetical protein